MTENFKLIVITPERTSKEESSIIAGLFNTGLQTLHVRKPDHTRREVQELIAGIPADFHSRIVLHQHHELLYEFNLKGAHLSEYQRQNGAKITAKNIISTSFHRLDNIRWEQRNFQYAFLSPVFNSISKKGRASSFTIETLRSFFMSNKSTLRFPLIALGGITESTLLLAKEAGFGGAACLGSIWENANPIEQFKKLQDILQS